MRKSFYFSPLIVILSLLFICCEDSSVFDNNITAPNDLISLQKSSLENSVFEIPYVTASPVIDGTLGTLEWSNANSYDLTFYRNDGADTHPAMIYLQHDGTWLYIGANSGFGRRWDVYMSFRMDGNNDHLLTGNPTIPHIDLQFDYPAPGAWGGYNIYRYLDGIIDPPTSAPLGTEKASAGSNPVTFEFKISIADLGTHAGATVGFTFKHGNDGTTPHDYSFPEDYDGALRFSPEKWPHFKLSLPVIPVHIDIKPGGVPNAINPNSKEIIAVAILTTETFDATEVDPNTVKFGSNQASKIHKNGHFEDIDLDGDLDLVLHFKVRETGIQCGDNSVLLTGETYSGQAIEGTDFIKTVGCK